jgi:hypothetical protein
MLRNVLQTDLEKSFAKQKLVFKEGWMDKYDYLIVYSIFGLIAGFCISTIKDDFFYETDKFTFLTVYGLLTLFSLYIIYRKATEKHLIRIKTEYTAQENVKVLMNLAHKQELGIYYKSNNFLIFNNPIDLNPGQNSYMIFLVTNNLILFTILHDRQPIFPSLVLHLFIKRDIGKLLKKSNPI